MKLSTYNSFKEVLESQRVLSYLPRDNKWWSKHIYHFSDVNNIANILNTGFLYSRNHPKTQQLMKNDNASQSVIDGTTNKYKDYVRFYFRPLTPTQYQNEGIRSVSQLTSLNAHCPVPIFLVFNADKILSRDDSFFSYESLASHHDVPIYQSLADFEQAPFNYIYHHTPIMDPAERDKIVKHRHAEIIIKDEYDLSELELILCRSLPDALTLRTLLTRSSFEKYKSKIKLANPNFYFNMHLYLKKVSLEEKILKIEWGNLNSTIFDLKIDFLTIDERSTICYYYKFNFNPSTDPDKIDCQEYLGDFPKVIVQIRLDDNLVYKNILLV